LKSDQRDGHAYLSHAARAGAAGAVVTAPDPGVGIPQLQVDSPIRALQIAAARWRQQYKGALVGVTGSVGKTSTKDILALLLGGESVHRTFANYNNLIGVPLTLLRLNPLETPYSVVEIGANGRDEIGFLADLVDPTHAIITAVTEAHLEGFGSLDGVAREKAWLGRFTRPGGVVVLPGDCLRFPSMREFPAEIIAIAPHNASFECLPEGTTLVRWSREAPGPVTAGCRLTLSQTGAAARVFDLPAVSQGMVRNATLAIVMAGHLGVSDSAIEERLKGWRPAALRGEWVTLGDQRFYLDCYNASPAAFRDAFSIFEEQAEVGMPRLYILGCMAELGSGAADLHRETASSLHLRDIDRAVLIGDNTADYRTGLLAAGNRPAQVEVAADCEEVRDTVSDFHGAIFLKGSRKFALENLLPSALQGGTDEGEGRRAC